MCRKRIAPLERRRIHGVRLEVCRTVCRTARGDALLCGNRLSCTIKGIRLYHSPEPIWIGGGCNMCWSHSLSAYLYSKLLRLKGYNGLWIRSILDTKIIYLQDQQKKGRRTTGRPRPQASPDGQASNPQGCDPCKCACPGSRTGVTELPPLRSYGSCPPEPLHHAAYTLQIGGSHTL
jgi:hypothetical protein